MAKQMHSLKLTGLNKDRKPARIGSEVVAFYTPKEDVKVLPDTADTIVIKSINGANQVLTHHDNLNIFQGIVEGTKVQVSLKKTVGELRWWA